MANDMADSGNDVRQPGAFKWNPAHPIGTCGRCGGEMVHNVPRLGPDGGFVHKATGTILCKKPTQQTPSSISYGMATAGSPAPQVSPAIAKHCPFCGSAPVGRRLCSIYNVNALDMFLGCENEQCEVHPSVKRYAVGTNCGSPEEMIGRSDAMERELLEKWNSRA